MSLNIILSGFQFSAKLIQLYLFIQLLKEHNANKKGVWTVYFHGQTFISQNLHWDGNFSDEDKLNYFTGMAYA